MVLANLIKAQDLPKNVQLELNRVTWTSTSVFVFLLLSFCFFFWPNHFLKANEQFKLYVVWSGFSWLSCPENRIDNSVVALGKGMCVSFLWQVKNLLMPSSAARSTCYNFYFPPPLFFFHMSVSHTLKKVAWLADWRLKIEDLRYVRRLLSEQYRYICIFISSNLWPTLAKVGDGSQWPC